MAWCYAARDWAALGVWDKAHRLLLEALGDEGVLNLQRVAADSASVRAQKGAHSGPPIDRRKSPPGRRTATGRSRASGWSAGRGSGPAPFHASV